MNFRQEQGVPTLRLGWGAGLLVASLLVASLGCGGKLPVIQGTITLDDQPLPQATVIFLPDDANESPAQGITDENGRYTLEQDAETDGVQLGEYSVRITTYQPGSRDVEPPVAPIRERVPRAYNLETSLRATIVAKGESNFDFALKSQGEIFQPEPDSF